MGKQGTEGRKRKWQWREESRKRGEKGEEVSCATPESEVWLHH